MLKLRITDYPAGGTMAPHFHDEPSMIVVVSGGYEERIQGTAVEHGAGRMLFYPAGAIHSQRFAPAGSRKIVFTPDSSSLDYLRERGVSLDVARYADAPVIAPLSRRLVSEFVSGDPFSAIVVEGLALELVGTFARSGRSDATATPAWLCAARDAVHDSVGDEALSVAAIAAQVGKHPVHLARQFHRYFGMTIGAYRRNIRLQRAEEMLRTKRPLTEVAMQCGYASQSHFCRAFKSSYGLTPSQFRALH